MKNLMKKPISGDEKTNQYLLVSAGENRYGIHLKYVGNVLRVPKITRVPNSQDYFKGIISLRGEIIAVMSLSARLSALQNAESVRKLEDDLFTDESRIVILNIGDMGSVGLLVEQTAGMAVLQDDMTDCAREEAGDAPGRFASGISTYEGIRILLLDVEAIV